MARPFARPPPLGSGPPLTRPIVLFSHSSPSFSPFLFLPLSFPVCSIPVLLANDPVARPGSFSNKLITAIFFAERRAKRGKKNIRKITFSSVRIDLPRRIFSTFPRTLLRSVGMFNGRSPQRSIANPPSPKRVWPRHFGTLTMVECQRFVWTVLDGWCLDGYLDESTRNAMATPREML